MPDVFISYSRKDKDFVGRLYQALAEHKSETWVDWEGIPPTAEWLEEIFRAIEAADSFVFVISPDGVVSEICQMEIAHALKYNKRLVPVVRREVTVRDVPPELAKCQWIPFRDHDDFNASFQDLITALNTDLEHVRTHTRLLVKALEWERKGRDKSFLLRGRDLKDAEAWLAESGTKEPMPTELQVAFILNSRKAANFRKRLTLGAISVGLMISLLLGLIALFQHKVAESRNRIALSRHLAAQSKSLLDSRLDLALLLALEAVRVADTVEAKGSLLAGLFHNPRLIQFFHGHKNAVQKVALSPDDMTLASGSVDKSVIFWSSRRGQAFSNRLSGHTEAVDNLAFSPDGKILASASRREIILWDVLGQRSLGLPISHKGLYDLMGWISALAFSPGFGLSRLQRGLVPLLKAINVDTLSPGLLHQGRIPLPVLRIFEGVVLLRAVLGRLGGNHAGALVNPHKLILGLLGQPGPTYPGIFALTKFALAHGIAA
jgi:hypothetical protein